MATVTTNYGFDVPTSSDLVKNGATQIALLGQDLDTFLFRPFTRNGVLNGSMNVFQRGTTATGSTTAFSADRWQSYRSVAGSTFSRQLTNDTTNLPGIQYCTRAQRDNGNTSTTVLAFFQNFETANAIVYAGKSVTFSFYARAGSNYSPTSSALTVQLVSGTGTDQNVISGYTGSANVINQTATLTTTWQRFTYTATVSAGATELSTYFQWAPTGTAGVNDYLEITGVMLEIGSQASPYTPATPTYATELAACQRYYYDSRTAAEKPTATAIGQSVSEAWTNANFATSMRSAPTVTLFSYNNTANKIAVANTTADVGSTVTAVSNQISKNCFIQVKDSGTALSPTTIYWFAYTASAEL